MSSGQNSARPILALSFPFRGAEVVIKTTDELELRAFYAAICSEDAEAIEPKVILLETIRRTAEGEGKYIRQTGGSGNYGHVKLRVEPRPEGTGFQFFNELPDSLLPDEYAIAAEAGVREAASGGVLFGHEVVDLEATLFDASFHDIDSHAMAFQIAGSMAFKEAARKASPVLLEPMMAVEFMVDLANVADTVSELNARRGRIESIEPHGGCMQIKAIAPLSEMLFSSQHGRPDYPMRFLRYEPTRQPPEKFGEDGAGVTANLPKSPHLESRSAAVKPRSSHASTSIS
jgi:translation elongation factor EF-G